MLFVRIRLLIYANFTPKKSTSLHQRSKYPFLEVLTVLFFEVSTSSSNRSIIRFIKYDDIQNHSIRHSTISCYCSPWSLTSSSSSSKTRYSSGDISFRTYTIRFWSSKSRTRWRRREIQNAAEFKNTLL